MVASVRARREFLALARARRQRAGAVSVRFVPGGAPEPRVAYAIGASVGSAVVRNRVRRRLRAVVAECAKDDLAPGLYLIGAGPDAVGERFDTLRRDLRRCLGSVRAA